METKYYIEIFECFRSGYILQSDWFDTREDAINWFKKISFIDTCYNIYLKKAVIYDDDTYECFVVNQIQ